MIKKGCRIATDICNMTSNATRNEIYQYFVSSKALSWREKACFV